MKKKMILLSGLTALSLALSACGSDEKAATTSSQQQSSSSQSAPQQDGSEKNAFVKYLDSVQPILKDNIQWGAKYEELRNKSANGQLSDADFAAAITNELIPQGTKIQERLEAVLPEEDFRNVHEKLNKMMAKNLQAMTELVAAVDTADMSKVTSANNLLAEARELDRQSLYDLQDLAKKYGVEFKQQ